ncbi:hypothetical protein ACFYUY_01525 [Kitasatospora sp. NPDC004745]|uniref:hypothetical protein n=1 Tax=Kitasatospora sp. NPDC004745 TaxID=3364019 RepID=UPI003677C33E
MIYRLHQDRTVRAVRESLPQAAADELKLALDGILVDPKAGTQPYGIDDGITRTLVLSRTVVVLLVNDETRMITLLSVTHLG